MHLALRISLRHFLMHDARPGGHPLHISGAKRAGVAKGIPVFDGARQHIGDGLDPAMGMPGKTAEEILGAFIAEIVEQQERVQLGRVLKPEGTVQFDPGALHGGLGVAGFGNGTDRHGVSLLMNG